MPVGARPKQNAGRQLGRKGPVGPKSKAGGRRPFKPKPDDNAKGKWLHHRLKVLKKVLKKAKTFEVRKIQRRMAQAKDAAAKPGASAAAKSVGDLSKLQAQLQCAKSLDLEQLAQHAAQSSGLAEAAAAAEGGAAPEKGRAAAAAPAHEAEQQDVGGQLQVVRARLLRSNAVRKELTEVVAEFNKRFRTAVPAPAEEGADDVSDSGDEEEQGKAKGKAAAAPGGKGAATKAQASSVSPALDGGDETDDDGSGSGSDDSGVIDLEAQQLSDLSDEDFQEAEPSAGGTGRGSHSHEEGEGAEELAGAASDDEDAGSFDSAQFDRAALDEDGEGSIDSAQWDAPVARHSESEGEATSSGMASSDEDDDGEEVEGSKKRAATQPKALKGSQGSKAVVVARGRQEKGGVKGSRVEKAAGQGAKDKAGRKKDKYDPRKDDPLRMRKPKNRLGQHARRKLAEQQFGVKAKHVRETQEQQQQGRGRSKEAGSSGGGAAAGAPVSEEQLHPSWAAKRKQTLSITAVAPAGKKIKFDEEGGEGYAAATSAAAAASGPVAGAKGQAAAASGAGKRGFAGGPGRKDGVGKVAGRGPAPGAVRPGGMKAGGRGAAGQAAGGGRGSGAPTSGKAAGAKGKGSIKAAKEVDSKPLHPSWEARKRAKELAAQQQMHIPKQPTGKKVVFDD